MSMGGLNLPVVSNNFTHHTSQSHEKNPSPSVGIAAASSTVLPEGSQPHRNPSPPVGLAASSSVQPSLQQILADGSPADQRSQNIASSNANLPGKNEQGVSSMTTPPIADEVHQKPKSFASVAKHRLLKPRDVPAYDYTVLRPTTINDKRCLVLDPAFHQRQIRRFSYAVHGRLLLRKGDSPHFAADLWDELNELWHPSQSWSIHPLGKGYFTMNFSNAEDLAAAFTKTTWRLRSGTLHLQVWVPNFDPYKAASTIAHVWVRIFNLPHEYWHPEVLSGVAREVGTPIMIDGISAHAHVGHFARVLVEMNVTGEVPDFLDIKCGDVDFSIEFGYENLSYFCYICNAMGHSTDECRKSTVSTDKAGVVPENDKVEAGFTTVEGRRNTQPKPRSN